jgi:hypothetical protein
LFGYSGIEVDWGVLKGIEKKLVHITLQYTTYQLNPLQYQIIQTSPKSIRSPFRTRENRARELDKLRLDNLDRAREHAYQSGISYDIH